MKLRELAHSRTGDKGNISNISVIAYRARDYPILSRASTADARQGAIRASIVHGDVIRYELPHLGALNFVLKARARRRRDALARARRARQGD